MQKDIEKTRPMAEQITYANVLFYGAWLGIFLMVVTYLLFATGLIAPHVPIEMVIQNWGKDVGTFIEITGAPRGWDWLALLNRGDYLTFVGLALLAILTVVCYFILLSGYVKRKDWTFALIALLEILVLFLAASGILGTGGH